jgi:hypothetical protein
MRTDVKEAVDLAKKHVAGLFAQEGLVNLGLEEVEYDDAQDQWRITVGFSRSWDQQGGVAAMLNPAKRTYKVVLLNKEGKPISVKNRGIANAA